VLLEILDAVGTAERDGPPVVFGRDRRVDVVAAHGALGVELGLFVLVLVAGLLVVLLGVVLFLVLFGVLVLIFLLFFGELLVDDGHVLGGVLLELVGTRVAAEADFLALVNGGDLGVDVAAFD